MQLPYLMPMFDDRPSIFGLPGGIVIFALGATGLTVGVIAVLRIVRRDPEPRAFRATNRGESILPLVAGVMAVGLVAFAVLVAIRG